MSWPVLIPIIAQYGLPVAEKLYQKWTSGALPTQADFDELRAAGQQTAADRMKSALVAAGIPLSDPKAVQLIALAS
jgi:hypothetical protein